MFLFFPSFALGLQRYSCRFSRCNRCCQPQSVRHNPFAITSRTHTPYQCRCNSPLHSGFSLLPFLKTTVICSTSQLLIVPCIDTAPPHTPGRDTLALKHGMRGAPGCCRARCVAEVALTLYPGSINPTQKTLSFFQDVADKTLLFFDGAFPTPRQQNVCSTRRAAQHSAKPPFSPPTPCHLPTVCTGSRCLWCADETVQCFSFSFFLSLLYF